MSRCMENFDEKSGKFQFFSIADPLICQQDMPAPWMGVLGKVAPSVLQLDDPAAAWAACLPG